VLIPVGRTPQPAPAASQRPVLAPRPAHPIKARAPSRGINEGSSNSPVRSSPRPRTPGWNGPPLRLSPELRTPPTKSRTTHVEVGTGHRARTWNYSLNITSGLILQFDSSLNACDLASHVRYRQRDPWRDGCCSDACNVPDSGLALGHPSSGVERSLASNAPSAQTRCRPASGKMPALVSKEQCGQLIRACSQLEAGSAGWRVSTPRPRTG